MSYPASDHVNIEMHRGPRSHLAIVATAKQGQLHPFLKYLSNLFLKTPVQEI